jgi:colicin import membrane protein
VALSVGNASAVQAPCEDASEGAASRPAATAASPPEPSYASKISVLIRSNLAWPEATPPDAWCEVVIDLDERGRILTHRVVKSQGHPGWCPAVLRALEKTERLPRAENGRVPPRMTIVFNGKR